ncbi:dynein light chain Tctex-type 5-B-like [Diorhabda carinulata]|uniref:dynein light chain Tctex-type 5-B-like n=1 Tax=Diorhabda carinulata TaxID=1163345 RepID=UPI0025A03A59|nr:dynein light chain Tctex-type 5-B-like [Diorhabda carinulata]
MADEQAPVPEEQSAEAPTEASPEVALEQSEAVQEGAESEEPKIEEEGPTEKDAASEQQPKIEAEGSVDKGANETSISEQGQAPDESDEPPKIVVTEAEETASEYIEEDEEQFDEPENYEDDMMKALGVEQDSLDALVKSSSMQIAKQRSMGSNLDSSMMVAEKMDKYAARTKDVLGEVIDIRRGSMTGEAGDRRIARFMNTYKLDSDNPFNNEKVDKILKSVMEETFNELKYDPEKCGKEAKWASNTIKAKVKQLEFERYKIISLVSIGEKHNQDVLCTCRFLWDAERDNYSCYTLENPYIFGIALCFGLYYE